MLRPPDSNPYAVSFPMLGLFQGRGRAVLSLALMLGFLHTVLGRLSWLNVKVYECTTYLTDAGGVSYQGCFTYVNTNLRVLLQTL